MAGMGTSIRIQKEWRGGLLTSFAVFGHQKQYALDHSFKPVVIQGVHICIYTCMYVYVYIYIYRYRYTYTSLYLHNADSMCVQVSEHLRDVLGALGQGS